MDRASIIGLLLGITAVVGGNLLEGGRIDSIVQPTAALIVFGGTLGATCISFPFSDLGKAFLALKIVFFGKQTDPEGVIQDMIVLSGIARKKGFVAIEAELSKIPDPFFRKTLRLAVDGMLPQMLVQTMERENTTFEDERRRIAKVFDTAGGFSPTIGIIGAVLGLIHVMENLADPSKLGAGIAVAFVATIYGVGMANLILLPIARKLINSMNRELSHREMVLEGIVGLQSGVNPYYLEEKLRSFVEGGRSKD
jgi:chemotaxis protein MotA